MNEKIIKEKKFHDNRFEKETRNDLRKYYSISHIIDTYFDNKLITECKGKKVLEYGCGLGSYAFTLSGVSSEVFAIDLSKVAIEKAKGIAKSKGINNIKFYEMNAEVLNFPDNYFDIVCGSAILHHLDLTLAYSELARVLKPEGKILFIEPLGHNLIISLYRRLTKSLRTEDEHPLMAKDIKLIDTYFQNKNIKYFYLFSLLAVPFRKSKNFFKISNFLYSIDQLFFKINFFKYQAWMIVIETWNPKKIKQNT